MEGWKRERGKSERRDREGEEGIEGGLPTLPQEIIAEILSWLPVKALCRFRCVSKSFLSLVSDPRFARAHLDRILRNDDVRFRSQRLLLSSHNLYSVDHGWVEGNYDCDDDLRAVELDYPLKDEPNFFSELVKRYLGNDFLFLRRAMDDDENEYPVMVELESQRPLYRRNWIDILGSSNGLVCISPAEGTIFLFNPATGESKKILEPSTASLAVCHDDDLDAFGFGFDSVHDDYKVVRLVYGRLATALVYSLRYDSWINIGCLPFDFADSFFTSGVPLNDSVHWVVDPQRDCNRKRSIVAFDLADEGFRDIPVPDDVNACTHHFRDFVVGVCGGCLCIVYSCHEMHDDVWLMREYGMPDSWTRLRISLSYRWMKPVCSWKNGEVLLEIDGSLVLYDLEEGTSRALAFRDVQFSYAFEADSYVESLISPNSYYNIQQS